MFLNDPLDDQIVDDADIQIMEPLYPIPMFFTYEIPPWKSIAAWKIPEVNRGIAKIHKWETVNPIDQLEFAGIPLHYHDLLM